MATQGWNRSFRSDKSLAELKADKPYGATIVQLRNLTNMFQIDGAVHDVHAMNAFVARNQD